MVSTKTIGIIVVAIIVIAAIAAAAYFVLIPKPKEKIKIGVITPLSPPADYVSGKLILETAQLFVEWKNKQGGVAGRELELVVADQTLDPGVAISHLQRMVTQDKIVGLIGPWESLVALPVAEATEKFPTIMFVTYSWADEITANHYKYVFRIGVYNSLIAGQSLEFFKWKNWRNIAVLVEESPYGFGQRDALVEWSKKIFPDVKFTFIPAAMGKADYTPELSKIKALDPKPDVLVIHLNVPHAFVAAKQAVELGFLNLGIKIYFGNDCPTWDPKSFWEAVGSGGVGSMFPTYYSPYMKLTKTGEEFRSLYRGKYGKDPFIALYWYWDCLRILCKAIEDTKSTDPNTLAKYIENIEIEGTTGTIKLVNDPTPKQPLWHQWIGMTQFTFEFTEFKQDPMAAKQVYPPIS
jgi:branched-chain amino acid transport system substrate-binding protein